MLVSLWPYSMVSDPPGFPKGPDSASKGVLSMALCFRALHLSVPGEKVDVCDQIVAGEVGGWGDGAKGPACAKRDVLNVHRLGFVVLFGRGSIPVSAFA